MVDSLGETTDIEILFWINALSAPSLGGFRLTQDETDHYSLLTVCAQIEAALDNPPPDYPGTYKNYVCALAAAAQREIDKWGRADEFERSCRRLAFYPSLARYVDADLSPGDLPSVLVNAVGARLKPSLFWAVLEKLVVVPVEDARRAISRCAGVLGLAD